MVGRHRIKEYKNITNTMLISQILCSLDYYMACGKVQIWSYSYLDVLTFYKFAITNNFDCKVIASQKSLICCNSHMFLNFLTWCNSHTYSYWESLTFGILLLAGVPLLVWNPSTYVGIPSLVGTLPLAGTPQLLEFPWFWNFALMRTLWTQI